MGLLEQAGFLTQHKTLGKFIMIRQQIRRLQRTRGMSSDEQIFREKS